MGAIITLEMVPNFVTCLPLYNEHCVKMLKMHRAGRQMILWKPVVYGHVSPCTMCTIVHCVQILKMHRDRRQMILWKPVVMNGHVSPPCCCSSTTDFQSPLEISPDRVRRTTFLVSFIFINLPLVVH